MNNEKKIFMYITQILSGLLSIKNYTAIKPHYSGRVPININETCQYFFLFNSLFPQNVKLVLFTQNV